MLHIILLLLPGVVSNEWNVKYPPPICAARGSNVTIDSEVQWYKNGDPIQQSEPVLTFSRVTAKDSGNYSCSLRNFKTTVSEEITIYIEAVMLIIRWKARSQRKAMEEREEAQDSLYSTPQKPADTNLPEANDLQREDEVEYSSVIIKPRELLQVNANTEQENDSTIYSAVMNG
ncbi:hypothetical protein Q8A67_007440 [Cirrhinus molitorella]|uniref:Ig-like domain-containing protein n=1 Tax=Cirrhinus molitorella TaxID=172907 RepID=A0AA88U0B7_9TELE|nr:hypothetical protein Q8A67_007440 [Cirrhinus molitorella]